MSIIEERPVTQKWIACTNCWNSTVYDCYNVRRSYEGFDIMCEVCGREGCKDGCMTWFHLDGTTHYYHDKCKPTGDLLKLYKKYELKCKDEESARELHRMEYGRDHLV